MMITRRNIHIAQYPTKLKSKAERCELFPVGRGKLRPHILYWDVEGDPSIQLALGRGQPATVVSESMWTAPAFLNFKIFRNDL
jgi:hypothetical protein